MGANSKIEWCDHTMNPWVGCQHVSDGCNNCYAEDMMDTRFGRVKWGPHGERQRTSESNWQKPRAWNRDAPAFWQRYRRRQRVFCASLCDVFDNQAPQAWRNDLWKLIAETPHLDWLLLTKRPENILAMMGETAPPNVWLGTTCEDQRRADHRVPILLHAAGYLGVRITFLSCEPLLGQIDLTNLAVPSHPNGLLNALRFNERRIDWVISGGESGPNARPSHPDWHRHLRDQCAAHGTPYLFKQWGAWEIASDQNGLRNGYAGHRMPDTGEKFTWLGYDGRTANPSSHDVGEPAYAMAKVGKTAAGRLLDGVEHNGFPAG